MHCMSLHLTILRLHGVTDPGWTGQWTRRRFTPCSLLSWLSGSSGAVCCAKRLACTICCRKNATRQWQTLCTMHSKTFELLPSRIRPNRPKFETLAIYTISLGPVLNWLIILYQLYQSSHWLLSAVRLYELKICTIFVVCGFDHVSSVCQLRAAKIRNASVDVIS